MSCYDEGSRDIAFPVKAIKVTKTPFDTKIVSGWCSNCRHQVSVEVKERPYLDQLPTRCPHCDTHIKWNILGKE